MVGPVGLTVVVVVVVESTTTRHVVDKLRREHSSSRSKSQLAETGGCSATQIQDSVTPRYADSGCHTALTATHSLRAPRASS